MRFSYAQMCYERYHFIGGVANRVVEIRNNRSDNTLIFVPGWASTESTWRFALPVFLEDFNVFYYESREKSHTKLYSNTIDYSLDSMSKDLNLYLERFSQEFILAGASVGASLIINGWKNISHKPELLILISPNLQIRMPKCFSLMRIIPTIILELVRPLILGSIKLLSYGADGHRISGLVNAMSVAHLDTARKSADHLKNMKITNKDISYIDVPTLVIGVTNDGLHNPNGALSVAEIIDHSDYISFRTFTEIHSSTCARQISKWIFDNKKSE